MPYGSELTWNTFQIPPQTSNGVPVPGTDSLDYSGLSLPYLRYQLLQPGKVGPDPSQWKFTDQYFQSMFPAANTFDAMSVNLKAFRAHGGKLIIWQGWADNGIPPTGTVDYYEDLEKFMGGQSSTQKFARLFLFPGEFHCGPGYTNSSFDLVYPMVQWVEGHTAPTSIIASDTVNGTALTRPVYPYPDIPKYNGSGDHEFGEQLPSGAFAGGQAVHELVRQLPVHDQAARKYDGRGRGSITARPDGRCGSPTEGASHGPLHGPSAVAFVAERETAKGRA